MEEGNKFSANSHLRRVSRAQRQEDSHAWGVEAFGPEETNCLPQRGIRLFEESAETTQATGVTREMAHKIVDHVWDRPVGELRQEIGGVGVTLLVLGKTAGIDVDKAEYDEVERVLSKPLEYFTARNAAKNAAGLQAFSYPYYG